MAANANGEYKVFKFYEGLCSSANFPKEIAKVLALGVKSDAIKDEDGEVITESEIIQTKNWDIVYPICDSSITYTNANGNTETIIFPNDENGYPDTTGLSSEEYKQKILNQVNKISDTVIIKTTTEKNVDDDEVDDLTVDASSNSSSLTMYLEIFKPTYIANPEEYPLDCERQGIIPKVITKELYEQAYSTSFGAEENIFTDKICSKDYLYQDTTGDVTLSYAECDSYVQKICNVKNDNGAISVPASGSTSVVIDSTYLAKVKQQEAALYSFILSNLNSGEGIEPKDYNQLQQVVIEIFKTTNSLGNDAYLVSLKGTTQKTSYTIPAGSIYTVSKAPTDLLTPEFYLDGIYTPLDTSKYHVADKSIVFDENIVFEAEAEGVLIIRYNYAGTGTGVISERTTLLNNHYVLMRMFDTLNETHSGPAENVYNSSGEITKTNAHVSPWSKLSWYQDFEEVMIDTIDSDVNVSSIQDGTVYVPLETAGLNSDTKMRYWINTNNDRFSLIVMGNPSLDYEKDRHLISGCYCGRIDSFENSINDTAGNFALFTSSSTEPCNTTLITEKVEHKMEDYIYELGKTNTVTVKDIIENCAFHIECTPGRTQYEIQLTDKTYFDRSKGSPKYIIVDEDGNAVTSLTHLYGSPQYVLTNGKADLAEFTIREEDSTFDNTHTIYFYYSYYEEKYNIISGVSRDVFGNVIDVDKVKSYGNNTSDGVTSIMMYHTRSKAYYQKHHMLFATTEEYMSKVMYGKSSYTGEYYADRIKVTHGNDGLRGTLSDLLVIDSASLYALDELVINKDFKKDPDEMEETFIYFPITAPYSPLSDSPNATYGLAIKKAEIEPDYADEWKLILIAINQLKALYTDKIIGDNIGLLNKSSSNCDIYWKVVDGSAWIETMGNKPLYEPIKIAVSNTSKYKGDPEIQLSPVNAKIESGETKATKDGTESYVKIKNFQPESGETVFYGISDTPITEFNKDAHLLAIMYDEAKDDTSDDDNGGWKYVIDGVPYSDKVIVDTISGEAEAKLINASPDKYLILYSAKETIEDGKVTQVTISKFACASLKSSTGFGNALLQYPSNINIIVDGGKGKIINKIDDADSTIGIDYINTTVQYKTEIKVPLIPGDGYTISRVKVVFEDGTETIYTADSSDPSTQLSIVDGTHTGFRISADQVTQNIRVNVTFVME